jgi:hypothetical protein
LILTVVAVYTTSAAIKAGLYYIKMKLSRYTPWKRLGGEEV